MIVEKSIKKTAISFCDLDYGDVFVLANGTTSEPAYFMTIRCDNSGKSYNAVYLNDGWLTRFDDNTPVYQIEGKFVIEE